MYRIKSYIILFGLLVFLPSFSFSLSFEGNISFIRESVYDTTYIVIMVKGELVRVDEFDQNRKLLSSQLVNLTNEQVVALSHEKKLYTHIPVAPHKNSSTQPLNINKTGNYKEINGYVCYQWRVKDVKRNTEVAYWVAQERFGFFETLLKLLNRTEHSLRIFSSIPENEGYFPLLTEERTLLRKDKLRIAVVDISEKNLNHSLFEIPQGYKSVR